MIDLRDVLFTQRAKPRGDEALPHVCDLFGCDRATWYRRRGERHAPFSPEKLALFAQGHAYESRVAHDLQAANVKIQVGLEVEYRGLKGHTDIVLWGDQRVVDTKLTKLRYPKPFASQHYAIQVLAYAAALGWMDGTVWVYHQGSDIEKGYDVNALDVAIDSDGLPFGAKSEWYRMDWADIIKARAAQVHARTGPTAGIPDAVPGELSPWGCKYCDWHQCERNPSYEPDGEIPL